MQYRVVARPRLAAMLMAFGLSVSVVCFSAENAVAGDISGPWCPSAGSADRCWNNYNATASYAAAATYTQYNRDQVCTKARDAHINGPVSGGSNCSAGGTNYFQTWFYSPGTPKKVYGYWAGNGGNIWVYADAVF